MRGLLTFMVIAAIGGAIFAWQKHNGQNVAGENLAAQNHAVVAKSEVTPAPRGQASEYNWMKRSLDRAADVRAQARARTKEAQDP